MRVITRVTIVMVAAALAVGCKAEPQACKVECPTGQYCGTNGKCTFDCNFDSDCPAGKKCSPDGQCLSPSAMDGGSYVLKEQGGTYLDGLPDLAARCAAWADTRGAPLPLILCAPKQQGRASEAGDALLAPLPRVAEAALAALDAADALGVPTLLRNLPHALLPGREAHDLDLYVREARWDLTTGREVEGR